MEEFTLTKREAEIRKKVPVGYKVTEVGVIPEDWEVMRLADLGVFLKGKGINRDQAKNGNIPCIRYGEIYTHHDYFVRRYYSWITPEIASKSTVLKKGDILFAGSGETKEEIGKAVAFFNDEEAYAGGDIIILRPQTLEVDALFLGYALNSEPISRQKASRGQGDAIVHITAKQLADIKIAIPPLHEQRAIAEALSDVDKLIESLDKLIAKKKAIKQAAMQQLLTGKVRLPGFSGEWEVKRLGEIGETYSGLSGKTKADFGHGVAKYIPFMNILYNTIIDPTDLEYVDIQPGEYQNQVKRGDLFFNGSSETPEEVGMCAVLQDELENTYLNSFCFGFRLKNENEISSLYLAYFFRSNEGRKLLYSLAQGATRYNLSKTNFLQLLIPLPSIEEQKEITSILSIMDIEIQALERRREKIRKIKQGMMQQLLTGRVRLVKPA